MSESNNYTNVSTKNSLNEARLSACKNSNDLKVWHQQNSMKSISGLSAQLKEEIDVLKAQSLYRQRKLVDSPAQTQVRLGGQSILSFCSNDYLGFANHPAVVHAVQQATQEWGAGSGASPLVSGYYTVTQNVERALAQWVGMPEALVFTNGYMANIGIITALVGKGDAIFSDNLNHACLIDGSRLSKADVHIFPHGKVKTLEQQLATSQHKRKLIITDAVFSMDGNIAPVKELVDLCQRYDAWLLLDDAHGFGVLAQGHGVLKHFSCFDERIIYMGTLGKAAGVAGAFVASSSLIIDYLVQKARTYVYSTAHPPALCGAILTVLQIMQNDTARFDHLSDLIHYFRQEAIAAGLDILPSPTPIQGVVLGDNQRALDTMNQLKEQGIWVAAIRPPTVPLNTARLRIALSAAHQKADIDRLLNALKACLVH